ncbi:RNA polymerase sigma factor [Pedobacter sp. MR2016-24]|uniref:RNA polymerase sigma factor n=1 Tax=Pedobacter sp. MR2016-24 TaxID=2994466 RepID=UPI0022450309|nr:sigma-70 family RNA polymerase sigma factor [Pedobacter sp. MR2016-24]MCX2483816.1 sigma-70 family RNA polymerase sigma factor [Pedobacter sp. MR2016-24]
MPDYKDFTDQQLADLLRSDNEPALKFLYDKFWEKLFYTAAKRLNDEDEAEEAVQDIFVNLWRRRHTLQIKVSFESYLAGAVKFEVLKKRAAMSRKDNVLSDIIAQTTGAAHNDSNLYDLHLLEEELLQTVNSLPEKCQLVFVMSRKKGLSNKQIASDLNISEKAVEKHITTALKVIKGRFGRYFYLLLILKGLI